MLESYGLPCVCQQLSNMQVSKILKRNVLLSILNIVKFSNAAFFHQTMLQILQH